MSNEIMLSPVGGQAIHGFIDYFKARGFFVVGIDSAANAVGRHWVDEFEQVAPVGSSAYAASVLRMLEARPNMGFVSWLDSEIAFWNNSLEKGHIPHDRRKQFWMNFRPDLEELLDKYVLFGELESAGIKTPRSTKLSDMVPQAQDEFPIFVKPRVGSGSRGTRRIDSRSALSDLIESTASDLESYIVQPFIDGEEFTIDFYSKDGVVINQACRLREISSGVSMQGRTVIRPEIEREVQHFSATFGIEGINNVQFIRDQSSRLWLTDFNPRPSGTLMLSIHAGVDLFENLLSRVNGHRPARFGRPKLLRMQRFLNEIYYA